MRQLHIKTILYCFAILLISCGSPGKELPALFSTDMLKRQFFEIDPSKDVSINTLHGSVIRIPANSFNAAGPVRFEVREAFTPAEILAAGLVTESNGHPLRSGGMIYLNATNDGKALDLLRPIQVSIPNQYYDSTMQVFKGVETDSGIINWQDPMPVDTTPQSLKWQMGKQLFLSKCASCHDIFRDMTGPGLKNIQNRGPWVDRKMLDSFVRNAALFASQNNYVRGLKERYGSVMMSFPTLTDAELGALWFYVNNETKEPAKMPMPAAASDTLGEPCCIQQNPCGNDTIYLPVPKQNKSAFEDYTDIDTTTSTPLPVQQSGPRKPEELEGLRSGFTDVVPTDGMYDFEIKTLGWYNIDAYVEGYEGASVVKVWADVKNMDPDQQINIYLFCPKNKTLSVCNSQNNGKYYFDKIDGGIPLFLGDRALLFAFGSKGDKMYYGMRDFTVRPEQTIQIGIRETTEDDIRQALLSQNLEGIDLGIDKKEMRVIRNICDSTGRPGSDTSTTR